MRKDVDDKKKLEKADERITHKIAKDIEKAERKRKIDTDDQEEVMIDTEARGSQEERKGKVSKKVRFSDEEKPGEEAA